MLPILGTLLSSGLNLLGNAVLVKGKEFLEEKTGIDLSKATLTQAEVLKLKQYEMEHEEELLKLQLENNKLDIEVFKIEAEDRSSARNREVELNNSTNSSWFSKNTTSLIALLFIIVYLAICFIGVFKIGVEVDNTNFNTISIGLTNIVMLIVGYYFGSSKDLKNLGVIK